MKTVPAVAAFIHANRDLARWENYKVGPVKLGNRVELDITAIKDPAMRAQLWDWWCECVALYSNPQGDVAWFSTKRVLFNDRQITSKTNRKDLVEVFKILESIPSLNPVLQAVTQPVWDVEAIERSYDLVSFQTQNNTGVANVDVSNLVLPTMLGGVKGVGEFSRTLNLEVANASWRDRRVRRLVSVSVECEELWAPLNY